MAKRMQSPSSINVYRQCPRKYFYQYILKMPTKPSIHLVRGSIVHEVLEKFFSINLAMIDTNDFEFGFKSYLSASLFKLWKEHQKEFSKLGLSPSDGEKYLIESLEMVQAFSENFCKKMKEQMKHHDFQTSFKMLAPTVEEEIINIELQVKGYIDAIHSVNDEIVIMDYKTSNKDELSPDYKLQLGIYALLYKLKYNKTPARVGINFLKFGEKVVDVDDALLEHAKTQIVYVHEMTVSNHVNDYPKKESALCKWSSGKCDFYDFCSGQKSL